MKYRLHNRLGSGGFPVQATLAAAGVDFEYVPLDSKPNQPLGQRVGHLNKWGQVPVLELGDGAMITELAAILIYLADTEPSVRNGPTVGIDDHAQFLRWSVFLSVNVYEGILRQSYAQRFYTGPDALDPNASDGTWGEDHGTLDDWMARSVRHAAKGRIHDAFLCIEDETRGKRFLLGDRLSPCDIFLAMLYAWHNQKPDLPKCTQITAHVATHAVIRPIWAQNFHDRLDFKWHEL